ncbi:MAG: hypothetical protein LBB26_03600 [Puniceicoccales bacterium]|jgi:hypothetical protein|nr:hypothetical protein [Puniceicoccales bacterium]
MLQEDALIGLFIAVDDVCKENGWDFFHDSGPACGLHLFEVWTIYSFFQLSGFKHFKSFYNGAMGIWLRPYFPKMPSYSQFLKLYHVLGKVVDKNLPRWKKSLTGLTMR